MIYQGYGMRSISGTLIWCCTNSFLF